MPANISLLEYELVFEVLPSNGIIAQKIDLIPVEFNKFLQINEQGIDIVHT
jgi:hypothetical protein